MYDFFQVLQVYVFITGILVLFNRYIKKTPTTKQYD